MSSYVLKVTAILQAVCKSSVMLFSGLLACTRIPYFSSGLVSSAYHLKLLQTTRVKTCLAVRLSKLCLAFEFVCSGWKLGYFWHSSLAFNQNLGNLDVLVEFRVASLASYGFRLFEIT